MPVKPAIKKILISAEHPRTMAWHELTEAYRVDLRTLKRWLNKQDPSFLLSIGTRRKLNPKQVSDIFRMVGPP